MNVLKEKTACSVSAEPQSAHECASIIHISSITPAEIKSKKNFYSIDGETLMNTPMPPIRFAISTLLPQGLSILAGAPKVGKSWLALQLCLAVAKGESLWGLSAKQNSVLYLCLEDSFARIQSRLFDIGDDAPANVHFVILADSIGTGLEEQIENFLSVNPDTSLIVIDTLQKVRNLTNDNAYASDYHDIGLLKAIADKYGIAVLLIHHLRKQSDDDPMNMVSGTTGITGAVDNSFVLKETKLNSYESQINYYTDKINSNREWKMAGIFADEGISGTRTKNRTEFLKLIDLCKKGKVDLILIKSLSRFARNTVDSLNHIRALKAMGIGIIFEKENLNTLELDNEVILTIHSCFAQAESESISANVKWGKRQSFKDGKVSFQYSRMLGYEKGEDGKPKIVQEQAALVRRIFYEYLDGKSVEQIRQGFDNDGITSPVSKKGWSREGLKNILRNEKYIGDALLQKTYVADVLTKKTVKNNGDIPQYYVSNHHEPIIDREIFNRVQEEMARRQGKRRVAQKSVKTEQGKYSGKYALSELLYCGNCGTKYRRCTWARKGEKKVVWRCINRLEYGTKYCKHSPTIEENRLHDAVLRAANRILANQEQYTEKLMSSLRISSVGDASKFDAASLRKQIADKNKAIMVTVAAMTKDKAGFEEIEKTAASIYAEIAEFEARLRLYEQENMHQQCENSRLDEMLAGLGGEQAELEQYDDAAVRRLVESVKVVDADNIIVRFRSGMEIGETLR